MKISSMRNLRIKHILKMLNQEGDSIEWENGEDVAPENLYYDSVDINEFQGVIKELDYI